MTKSTERHPSKEPGVHANQTIDDLVLDSIVKRLDDVEWASVSTLCRTLTLTCPEVMTHLKELKRRGTIDIGKRLIPPDWQTAVWLSND